MTRENCFTGFLLCVGASCFFLTLLLMGAKSAFVSVFGFALTDAHVFAPAAFFLSILALSLIIVAVTLLFKFIFGVK